MSSVYDVRVDNPRAARGVVMTGANGYHVMELDPWSYSVRTDDTDRLHADGGYFSIHSVEMKTFPLKFCVFPSNGRTVWDLQREIRRVFVRGENLRLRWTQTERFKDETYEMQVRVVQVASPMRNVDPFSGDLEVMVQFRAADPLIYGSSIGRTQMKKTNFGNLVGYDIPHDIPADGYNIVALGDPASYGRLIVNEGTVASFPTIAVSVPSGHPTVDHILKNETTGRFMTFRDLVAGKSYRLEQQGGVFAFSNTTDGTDFYEAIADQVERFWLVPGENYLTYDVQNDENGGTVSLAFHHTYI